MVRMRLHPAREKMKHWNDDKLTLKTLLGGVAIGTALWVAIALIVRELIALITR